MATMAAKTIITTMPSHSSTPKRRGILDTSRVLTIILSHHRVSLLVPAARPLISLDQPQGTKTALELKNVRQEVTVHGVAAPDKPGETRGSAKRFQTVFGFHGIPVLPFVFHAPDGGWNLTRPGGPQHRRGDDSSLGVPVWTNG